MKTLAERLEWALSDGRTMRDDEPAVQVATWCVGTRGEELSGDLINSEVVKLLRNGTSSFLHKVAAAMEKLEREGVTVADGKIIGAPIREVKVAIAFQWDKWENEKTKVEVRLAELRTLGFKIGKSRYIAIKKSMTQEKVTDTGLQL